MFVEVIHLDWMESIYFTQQSMKCWLRSTVSQFWNPWGLWKCFWDESSCCYLLHIVLGLPPLILSVWGYDISHVMSEAGVRVVPELLVRQTLNVTGSENRVLSRMFFRPVWPTYRSNHNTHVLVRGISRASTENSSLPGRFYFICHVWTCDKVIDPNPGEGTPWPCMQSTKDPLESTSLITLHSGDS